METKEFDGKRVLVTGGTKGMGLAIVQRLRRAGATVLTTARSVPEEHELPEMFIQADLSDSDNVAKVVKGTLERLDGVDILINNVGSFSSSRGDALTLSREDWLNTFNTNLFSVVQLDQGLLPTMLKQRAGALVTALTNYSKALSKQVALHGIRV